MLNVLMLNVVAPSFPRLYKYENVFTFKRTSLLRQSAIVRIVFYNYREELLVMSVQQTVNDCSIQGPVQLIFLQS
jgi:hypothetical protein